MPSRLTLTSAQVADFFLFISEVSLDLLLVERTKASTEPRNR